MGSLSESLNDALVHMTIAASPLMSIYPCIYIYNCERELSEYAKSQLQISCETLMITLPLAFGILFALLYNLLTIVPRKYNDVYFRFIFSGALAAALLSVMLQWFNVQKDMMHIEDPMTCHISVFIFYLFVFTVFGSWYRKQILYGPKQSSSASSVSPLMSPIITPKSSTKLPAF